MMSDLTGAPVKTRPFPFMKLPIELRLEVYRELLRFEDEIRMKTKWSINCLHPNILQACYRIYDEVVEVLYRESTFYIYYDDPGNTRITGKACEGSCFYRHLQYGLWSAQGR